MTKAKENLKTVNDQKDKLSNELSKIKILVKELEFDKSSLLKKIEELKKIIKKIKI
ncbi:hypothetical protein [Rickettsiella massiliensis]|uniref:hypothetical protein n=1 Tax=Rickettsiella massiliensis TaxID=676517 RepID=UPI0002FAD895|nr:hypothetical protein [Rickettsiella massiliensis]